MKPAFALSLSFDGISLLHRCAGGWRNAGDVSLEAADLAAALAGLRGAAARLDPDPIRTKIVIPNEQIRYLSVETGPVDAQSRDAQARAALEGATPYPVADLVYDVSAEGSITHVAAVARETLAEAEGFAVEHGFNPVSFVAIPGDKPFLGEPFFGPTGRAPAVLPAGETVEPDGIAIVVVGPAQFPVDGAVPAGPASTHATPPVASEPSVSDSAAAAAAAQIEQQSDSFAAASEPASPVTFSSRRRQRDAAGQTQKGQAALNPQPSVPPVAQVPDVAPTPFAPETAPAPLTAPDRAPSHPPAPEIVSATGPEAVLEPVRPVPAAPLATRDLRAEPVGSPPIPVGAAPLAAPQSEDGGGFLSRRKANEAPDVSAAAIDVSGMPARLAAAVLNRTDKHADPATEPQEVQRMTVFGAREKQARGSSRYLGLVLTAVLLLFLAGVAAWASLFLDDGVAGLFDRNPQAQTSDTQVTSPLPASNGGSDTRASSRAVQVESDGSGVTQFSLPQFSAPETGNSRALSVPIQAEQPVTLASLDPASVLSGTDAAVLDALRSTPNEDKGRIRPMDTTTRYAVTGIWAEAPPEPETPSIISLDGLYLGSIDNRDLSQDAVALPAESDLLTDVALGALVSPIAPETLFDLNERGLVRATPQGSLNPEGVLVYLGRPASVPPARPARADPQPQSDGIQERLAGFRPKARPDTLVEDHERGQLGGLTRNELAKVRPKARPETLKAVEEAADETATAQAVPDSRRPRVRPSNFSTRVAAQQSNPQNTQVAAIAPQTVTPSIPSKASVTRQATLNNAINLQQVNLIGVYGTPSDRRALVRLPSGRYKKVQVGDSIDGGRVVAIGDSELRYQKKGRNLTLKIPSG